MVSEEQEYDIPEVLKEADELWIMESGSQMFTANKPAKRPETVHTNKDCTYLQNAKCDPQRASKRRIAATSLRPCKKCIGENEIYKKDGGACPRCGDEYSNDLPKHLRDECETTQ